MSLALLYPAALAALLALVVPVLLHLARRPQQRTLDFAALRWIAAVHRPRRRLVVNERLLLALRLLLLALLALALAMPVLLSRPAAQDWVLVAPGADLAQARRLVADPDLGWRWLAPGFPPVDDAMPAPSATSSLLRELDAMLPAHARLTVVLPGQLNGLDGARLALGREVQWIVSDPASDQGDRRTAARPQAPSLAVRYPADREPSVRYLAATVAAWQFDAPGTASADIARADALPGASVDVLAWLHPGALPEAVQAWVAGGRTLILEPDAARDAGSDEALAVWRSPDGDVLAHARRSGAGRIVELTRPLQPDALPQLLDPGFPQTLRQILEPGAVPAAAPASAHAPLHSTRAGSGAGFPADRSPLLPWLALAIAALFLVERLLASRASRWAR